MCGADVSRKPLPAGSWMMNSYVWLADSLSHPSRRNSGSKVSTSFPLKLSYCVRPPSTSSAVLGDLNSSVKREMLPDLKLMVKLPSGVSLQYVKSNVSMTLV